MSVPMDELLYHISYGDRGSLKENMGVRRPEEYKKLLMFAVECGEVECLKIVAPFCNPDSTTALRCAAQYGHVACVEFLLSGPGKLDALIQSSRYGHLACVKAILPHCAPKNYWVALQHAIEGAQWEVADFMMDRTEHTLVLQKLYNSGHTDGIEWLEEAIRQRQHDLLHASVEHTTVNRVRKI